jgi:UDP-N-acetylglucosamine--N-acetylmuramyl-(pentapeptide) pyrophosphoryl-undecaprenol N-acetylglucosamine transferase
MSGRRVIISGGGTGGHLYPALVVGRKLQDMDRTIELTYVGTHREVEKKIMDDHGVQFTPISIEGLKGRGFKGLKSLAMLPVAFGQSLGILRRTRPCLVIGVGGFSSGPIVLMASWLDIPTLILEQNARPGFTNRLLGRWVRKAVVAFPSSLPFFKGKGVCLGNPVREEFYALRAKPRAEGLAVLVFGGSQGSRFLNEKMTAALPLLAPTRDGFRITHQTGARDVEWVTARYRASGYEMRAEVVPYITDMPGVFGRADLVVSRAGATTLAEIMAARKAAILVPFAGAAEDHQSLNARELEAVGGAEVIPELRLTPEVLAGRLFHYMNSPGEIDAMEKKLAALGIENPVEKIAGLCLSLMTGNGQEQPS